MAAAGRRPSTSPRCGSRSTWRRRRPPSAAPASIEMDRPRTDGVPRGTRPATGRGAAPDPPGGAARGRPVRRLGRDRPAAEHPDRADDRGGAPPARRRRRPRQRLRLGDGAGPDERPVRGVRDPARPRPRVPRPLHDPRPEPDGPRIGAARRPRARGPQHHRADRRPAADRRLPDRDRDLGRRFDRADRDADPAQPRRGPDRRDRSASAPASPSPARSTRPPPTPPPNGTASSASSRPARTW